MDKIVTVIMYAPGPGLGLKIRKCKQTADLQNVDKVGLQLPNWMANSLTSF